MKSVQIFGEMTLFGAGRDELTASLRQADAPGEWDVITPEGDVTCHVFFGARFRRPTWPEDFCVRYTVSPCTDSEESYTVKVEMGERHLSPEDAEIFLYGDVAQIILRAVDESVLSNAKGGGFFAMRVEDRDSYQDPEYNIAHVYGADGASAAHAFAFDRVRHLCGEGYFPTGYQPPRVEHTSPPVEGYAPITSRRSEWSDVSRAHEYDPMLMLIGGRVVAIHRFQPGIPRRFTVFGRVDGRWHVTQRAASEPHAFDVLDQSKRWVPYVYFLQGYKPASKFGSYDCVTIKNHIAGDQLLATLQRIVPTLDCSIVHLSVMDHPANECRREGELIGWEESDVVQTPLLEHRGLHGRHLHYSFPDTEVTGIQCRDREVVLAPATTILRQSTRSHLFEYTCLRTGTTVVQLVDSKPEGGDAPAKPRPEVQSTKAKRYVMPSQKQLEAAGWEFERITAGDWIARRGGYVMRVWRPGKRTWVFRLESPAPGSEPLRASSALQFFRQLRVADGRTVEEWALAPINESATNNQGK